jgi:3-hydroxy-3-methylglutaryl CoA synthase
MVGMISYGIYIPRYRLNRDMIARAWGTKSLGGERSVASYDEDSITMSTEAAFDCLRSVDFEGVDGLFFASTTSPYIEKLGSALVAPVVDIGRNIITGDYTNSLRSGTIAIRSALDAVKSGSANKVLVTVSDCRLGLPGSNSEQNFGDGAVAVLLGDSDVAVTVEGTNSISDEFIGTWRMRHDDFVRTWEEKFVVTEGYIRNIQESVSAILHKYNLRPGDFSKIVLPIPDMRVYAKLTKNMGFGAKTRVDDYLLTNIGDTGSAFSLMMLIYALEECNEGNKILFVNYGDGTDAFILKVTKNIDILRAKRRYSIKEYIENKSVLPSYAKYLKFRNLIPMQPSLRPERSFSAPLLLRDRRQIFSLYGSKCKHCSVVQFPPQRVCLKCQAKDEFEFFRISNKDGRIFTYTIDYLGSNIDQPTIMAVIEMEGGCRFYCQLTDCDYQEVKIDMPVEMTFRKLFEAGGAQSYFWKSKPVRIKKGKEWE